MAKEIYRVWHVKGHLHKREANDETLKARNAGIIYRYLWKRHSFTVHLLDSHCPSAIRISGRGVVVRQETTSCNQKI